MFIENDTEKYLDIPLEVKLLYKVTSSLLELLHNSISYLVTT